MSVEVHHFRGSLEGETEFTIVGDVDEETSTEQLLRVHPWSRYRGTASEDNSVFISVGWFNTDGSEPDGLENPVWNTIVDRGDFVTGILAAFPELTRKEAE